MFVQRDLYIHDDIRTTNSSQQDNHSESNDMDCTISAIEPFHREDATSVSSITVASERTKSTYGTKTARPQRSTVQRLTPSRLRIPSYKLYGREAEQEQIENILQQQTTKQLIRLYGQKGVGKSALAAQLAAPTRQAGGFYLTGTWEPHSNPPYAGWATACRQLGLGLLSLQQSGRDSDEDMYNSPNWKFTLGQVQEKLKMELGQQIHALNTLMPPLTQIVGPKQGGDEFESVNKEQLQQVFGRFLTVVASFGPIVFVLENFQWADKESLELLQGLWQQPSLQSIIIVVSYCDEEVKDSLIETLNALEVNPTNGQVTKIPVRCLTVDHVNQMLVDTMVCTKEETRELAECVHRKTLGNVYFVIQFLQLLLEERLLQFNIGIMKWAWNISDIILKTNSTDNVVVSMQSKVHTLPEAARRLLPIIASLGSMFSYSILAMALEYFIGCTQETMESAELHVQNNSNSQQIINLCVTEGLLEKSPDETYRWTHEKVREVAMKLVDETELRQLQIRLGEFLIEHLTQNDLASIIFVVVDLLSEITDRIRVDDPRRLMIAELNLQAALKAMQSSEFLQATKYLKNGIEWLPSDHWQKSYKLSLDLYSTVAEATYSVGDFQRMRLYCQEIFNQRNRPLLDKRRAYNVLLDSYFAEGHYLQAQRQCLKVLAWLGCRFPTAAVKPFIFVGMLQSKAILKKMKPEQISQFPMMTDENKIWAMFLLNKLVTVMYLSKSELLPFAIFTGLRLTFRYGISEVAPSMFSLMGFLLASRFCDFKSSQIYANQAMSLLKQRNLSRLESRTMYVTFTFCSHWSDPIEGGLKFLLEGFQSGMASGDTESAAFCMYFYLKHFLLTGGPLQSLADDLKVYADKMIEWKQSKIATTTMILRQVVLNLLGESRETVKIQGDAVDENRLLKIANETKNVHLKLILNRWQMYMAFVFEDYESVVKLIRETRMDKGTFCKMTPGIYELCPLYFHNSLTCFSMALQSKKSLYLKMAKKLYRQIAEWNKKGVRVMAASLL